MSERARKHTPHIQRGRYATRDGDDHIVDKWDSLMPEWQEWRGDELQLSKVPCFNDPQGFTVPLAKAHDWQGSHSHQQCLVERGRSKWQDLLSAAKESGELLSTVLREPAREREVAELVRQYGIPTELRQTVWPALLGSDRKRAGSLLCNKRFYLDLVTEYEADTSDAKDQIRTDLHRTLSGQNSVINSAEGIASLERVLGAFSRYNQRIGYCQAMNYVAAHLLCNLGEEEAFWVLVSVVHDLVPEYYGPHMEGLQAHTTLLERTAKELLPETFEKFDRAQVPMGLIAAHWMLPLFSMTLPPNTLHRLWDLLFLHGSKVLLCAALTMMRGTPADSLADFQDVMEVLQHGAEAYYDAASFIEHTANYAERLIDGDVDAWFGAEMDGMERRLALLQACHPLHAFVASAEASTLNFPKHIAVAIGAVWFEEWKQLTTLKACSGDGECELPFEHAANVLRRILPGLRKHAYMADRLLVAFLTDDAPNPMAFVAGVSSTPAPDVSGPHGVPMGRSITIGAALSISVALDITLHHDDGWCAQRNSVAASTPLQRLRPLTRSSARASERSI